MLRRVSSLFALLLILACPAAAELSPLASYSGTWALDAYASLALAGQPGGDQGLVLQRLSERLTLQVDGERLVFVRGQREDVLWVDAVVLEDDEVHGSGLRITGRTDAGRPMVLHLQELAAGSVRLRSDASAALDGCIWKRVAH